MIKNIILCFTIIFGLGYSANAQIPAPPTYTGTTTICTGGTTTLTAIGVAGATYTWYSAPAGGTVLSSIATYTTPVLSTAGIYHYYVSQTNNGFTSNRTDVVVTVNQTPTVVPSATPAARCEGQSSILSATGATTYLWTPGNLTGSPTVTPASTQTYSVIGTTLGCSSPAVNVTITIESIPSIANQTICAGTSATLTTSNANTYTWSPGGMTTNSVVVSPAATTVYTVTGTFSPSGCTSQRTVTVTVNPTPGLPTVTPNFSITSGSTATLTANQASSTSYSWSTNFGNYGPLTGATVTVKPTTTTTYSVVSQTALGCNSPAASVVVTVNQIPRATGNTAICVGGTTALTGIGGGPFTWYTAQNGGILLFTGPTYTTPALSTSTSYWVSNAGSPRKEIKVYVFTGATNVLATPASICTGSSSILSGDVSGGQINWYTTPTGGTSIGTTFNGSTLTVSPGTTTTYYAEGQSTQSLTTFNYTGGVQTWTVPPGVTSVEIDAYGADGGNSYTANPGVGGNGGRVQASLNVIPGQILNIYVGQRGQTIYDGPATFNGGGRGSASGGGATDIRIGGTSLTDRVLVAGGGGGAEMCCSQSGVGGVGGNVIAGDATGTGTLAEIGKGGTQTNGGGEGFSSGSNISSPGGFGFGGSNPYVYSSGGGGGWYGGGGSYGIRGAGGGSSYSDPSRTQSVIYTQGVRDGDGVLYLSFGSSCTAARVPVTVTISNIAITPSSQTNVSCNLGSNGSASINTPTGGGGGYTYNWTPGNPTGDGTTSVTGLTAGVWTCTVTDVNGCARTQNFTITQPTAIVATAASQTNVSCFGGSNGAASINTPTGGTGGYSYNWTPGNPTGDGTASVTGLTAGTWTCTVTDANACTKTQNFTVTQPTALNTATGSQTNVSCNGGSNGTASVTPSGGTSGYTYSWSPSGGTAATASGLSAGVYTVTVTDANSCTATRSFTITQPTAIVVTAASQTNVSCFGGSNGAASINTPTGGTGGYSYNWTPGNPTGDGTVSVTGLTAGTWTCTVTDANACTKTQNFTVTQPTAIVLTAASQTNVSCFGGSNGAASINTPTGGAGGYTYNWTPGNPTGDGTTSVTGLTAGTWTCTVTDANACIAAQSFTLTQPIDLILPILNNVFAECNVWIIAPATNNACGGTTIGTTTTPFPITTLGTTVVTWTFDNGNGNTYTQTQNVIITDVTAPVPDDGMMGWLQGINAQCSVTSLIAPTATDNCLGTISGTHNAILPITAQGTTIVTWTYDDGNGNISTQTQNVVLTDITAPIADNPVLADITSECSVATLTAPTATDNCAGTITGTHNAMLPIIMQGTTLVTWTYDDGNGNTSTQTQNVVITDVTPPTIVCPADVFIDADPLLCAIATPGPVVYDIPLAQIVGSVGISPLGCNGTVDVYNGFGPMGISWTDLGSTIPTSVSVEFYQSANFLTTVIPSTFNGISDGSYMTTLGGCVNYTVNQTLNPSNYAVGGLNTVMINTPADGLVWDQNPSWSNAYARVSVYYSFIGSSVVSDNCGIASVLNNAPSVYPVGPTTVTWTVMDIAGNSTTCDQVVTVIDVTAPMADNATLADLTDECSIATLTAPTATDNCVGTIIGTHNATVLPITAQGTTVVTWSYVDGNGNTATQTQNVVITDVTAPVSDLSSLADLTACFEVTPLAPSATDNCTGALLGTSDVNFPITTAGLTIVTWTYTDGNGNSSTQTQNVNINTINSGVTATGNVLTANAGATYQWLDCDNGNALIAGETNQSYTPAITGNYAVELTQNGCVDTSACFLVDYTGIENLTSTNLLVYPNPSMDGHFSIQFDGSITAIELFDIAGRSILIPYSLDKGTINASALESGKYLIRIYSNKSVFNEQLVIAK